MARELGLNRSTTHRYATTLVRLGYLEQDLSRKYRLASRVSDLGFSLLDSMVVRCVAREHLRELRVRTGRTASLGVLGGAEVVYIDRWPGSCQGQYEVDAGIGVGTRLPLHCTAAGKALLACLPVAEQQGLVPKLRLKRRAPKTITTKAALHDELERILAQGGIAIEDEEVFAGRRALAAVANVEGQPAAAVELTVPAQAYSPSELLEQLGPKVSATAGCIALALERVRSDR